MQRLGYAMQAQLRHPPGDNLDASTANEEWQHFQTLIHTTSRFRLSFIDCRCQLGMGQVGRVSACLGRTPDRFSIPRQRLIIKRVDDTNVRARSYYGKHPSFGCWLFGSLLSTSKKSQPVRTSLARTDGHGGTHLSSGLFHRNLCEARERPLEPVTRVYCRGSCCGIVLSAGAMSSLTLA